MNLSFWEYEQWFRGIDITIVGAGFVGLHTALALREKFPDKKILLLERGSIPQGASTKNAGFSCFGSVTELIDDLESRPEEEVLETLKNRWEGVKNLEKRYSKKCDFKNYGGYELILDEDEKEAKYYREKCETLNHFLKEVIGYPVFTEVPNIFNFNKTAMLIHNSYESQLNPAKLISALQKEASEKDIFILNNAELTKYKEQGKEVEVTLNKALNFLTKKIVFTTNAFAQSFLKEEVIPARAQVLITEPIKDLHIKGTFHIDKGYYYFRNVGNRILLGGARNFDKEGETTTTFGLSDAIQNQLEKALHTIIMPHKKVAIEHRWSGIMGVGSSKKPIIKAISNQVFCGVRMGGMGVALSYTTGKKLAELIVDKF